MFQHKTSALFALLLLASGVGLLSSLPPRVDPHPSAAAGTFTVGSYNDEYSGSVIVDVPASLTNTSWYTNWIMLVAAEPDRFTTPFVQIGEMRFKNAKKYPSLFVAYRMPGQALIYQDYGRLPEGEHAVAISGDKRSIALKIGRREVERFPRSLFFHRGDRVYYQFSTEVDGPGDSPSGYLRQLEVKDDHWRVARSVDPACLFFSRGIDIHRVGDRFVPFGRYRIASNVRGFRNCAYTKGWRNINRQS